MINCPTLSESLAGVLAQVLFLDVTNTTTKANIPMPSGERWVAAVEYFGDLAGVCMMAMTEDDAQVAVAYILKTLGLEDMYIPPFTVYPEILNMLSGHLITCLEKKGEHYQISSPREQVDFSPYDMPAQRVVQYETNQNFTISFYFYAKDLAA